MTINLLVIALLCFALWRVVMGWRNGFAREAEHLVLLVFALLVIFLVIEAVLSFRDGNTQYGVIAVILLLMVGLVLHILKLILGAVRTIAELPVISWVNRLLGVPLGLCETVLVLWVLFALCAEYPDSGISTQILTWTRECEWLLTLYVMNPISLDALPLEGFTLEGVSLGILESLLPI